MNNKAFLSHSARFMQLSNEDNLRLHVLLAQPLQAIRINEGTLTVHALTDKGEAKVQLNPTVRDETYLRWVRELISTRITGSPGGYPVFLQRWTRMGHTRNKLEHMLLLGEPEAIAAVVHAPSLSHEMAKRAWWAYPSAENARRLLEKSSVVTGELGKELAAYLLEFLPFEEQALDVVDTVRLCLQGDLISHTEREKLWNRAKRKNPYYVGFLHANAAHIPLNQTDHPSYAAIQLALVEQLAGNNPFANVLSYTLAANGQKWLRTLLLALEKPVDQEVVTSLFKAIQKRFNLPLPETRGVESAAFAQQRTQAWLNGQTANGPAAKELTAVATVLDTEQRELFAAILILGQLGEDSLNTIFGGTDAVGSVMRKRLAPLLAPMVNQAQRLIH